MLTLALSHVYISLVAINVFNHAVMIALQAV